MSSITPEVLAPENDNALATPPADQRGGTITRQGFGTQEMQVTGETSVTAAAAAAKAEIEAAYIVAIRRPRNMDLVYERILNECKRPSFAGMAMYSLPRGGKKITGLTVRFVEAALRAMGNVMVKPHILFDDENRQLIQVVALDLETNTRFEEPVIVEKSVERKTVKEGTKVLGSRRNSEGLMVYLVPATEDDMRMKRGAEVSRARRNAGMQLIPGDIIEDAKRQIVRTQNDKAAKDPEGERKALILGFSEVGVSPEQLVEYLGHELARSQPAELVELRQLWRALEGGQTTWRDVMTQKAEALAAEGRAATAPPKDNGSGLKAKVAGKSAEKKPEPPAREPGDDSDELPLK